MKVALLIAFVVLELLMETAMAQVLWYCNAIISIIRLSLPIVLCPANVSQRSTNRHQSLSV